jgi:hypothetical protein
MAIVEVYGRSIAHHLTDIVKFSRSVNTSESKLSLFAAPQLIPQNC